jgi:prolycopene isomerase
MALKNIKDKYDVVIIGSGIGGLVASCMLSRAGLSVLVLERGDTQGGYLMGFTRHRFTFDTAIHWLNQCLPGGMVHFVFESFGTDYPKVTQQKRVKRLIGDEFDYLLTNNPDELKKTLQEKFPEDKKGIEKFFETAKGIGVKMANYGNQIRSTETMNIFEKIRNVFHAIKFVMPFLPHIRFAGEEKLRKGLSKYFKNKKLHQLFASEKDMLSCLIPIGWAYAGDYLNPPTGGSQSFTRWLRNFSEKMDAQLFTYCDVKKVLVENNKAIGVELNHRSEIYRINSDYVIAACDVEQLYKQMLPPNTVPKELIKRLEKAEMYDSSFTIHMALNCTPDKLGFNEEMIFISKQDVHFEEHTGGDPHKTEIIILAPSFRDPSMAPEGKGTITIFMPTLIEHNNYWGSSKDEKGEWIRGESYNKCKEEVAQVLIDRVAEKINPKLREYIEFYEVSTPITHERYSGNKNGTMMGARTGKANYQAKIAHYQTPVDHLILGGHWAELGGGVPIATKAGFNAALLILKQLNIKAFDEYVKYIDGDITAEGIRKSNVFKKYNNDWERKLTPSELLSQRRNNA